jgi:Ca2+-binding EF-hand superfamily protein
LAAAAPPAMGVLFSKASWTNWCNEMRPIKDFWVQEDLVKFQRLFEHIGIADKKVRLLLQEFRKMDKDNSGTVSVFEFFAHFDFQFVSPMARRFFTLFDDNSTGALDFAEFCACVWNYNSLNEMAIIDFAFQIYDIDNTKSLEPLEIVRMLEEAYGSQKRMDQNTTDLIRMLRVEGKRASVSVVEEGDDVFAGGGLCTSAVW